MVTFDVENLWSISLFGFEVWITQTIVNTWIVMLLIAVAAIILRIAMGRAKEKPSGIQNVMELIVEASDGFVENMGGQGSKFVSGWFFAVFTFVLISNLSALFGFRPPTADFATTFALAFATFFLIQVSGVRGQGISYFKSYFQPIFIMFPLNLIGELSKPISLSFRLFGNLLSGLIMMTLVYALLPTPLLFGLPMFLHAFFDVAMGVLQAYIFCALSLAFIGAASSTEG